MIVCLFGRDFNFILVKGHIVLDVIGRIFGFGIVPSGVFEFGAIDI
jgi:hypothetical protein